MTSERILLVGAGGVGCEILKNLVLMQNDHIDVVDMDTIEVSNLNRQFLFRRKHVGQPKAIVAVEAVRQFAPSLDIQSLVSDITSFGVDFFVQYRIVFNALDNREARSYVNRMCVAVQKPLVESGTSGFIGQAGPIIPFQTECYDCHPKPSARTYPACTIRNTPSEMIHCVIWSKALFNQLFGPVDLSNYEDNDVSPDQTDDVNHQKSAWKSMTTRSWAENHGYSTRLIFQKIFNDDINLLLSMSRDNMCLYSNDDLEKSDFNQSSNDQRVLPMRKPVDVEELVSTFDHSIRILRMQIPILFDKDHVPSMEFVYAASNLRAMAFHIQMSSLFDIKSQAGNIIPAIASTNAIVAALAVHQGKRIMAKQSPFYVFVKPNKIEPLYENNDPNPECYTCGGQNALSLLVNPSKCTLAELRDAISDKLGLDGPIDLFLADGRLMPDEDDAQNNQKLLSTFGIGEGGASLIMAETDSDDRFQIVVRTNHNPVDSQIEISQTRGIKRKHVSDVISNEQ